ncbi:hypothetical protein, conserved [Babesia ovata]|uniref:Uncharacterized protein n=1 Tax=Babesia ovata TaxID=189622 RepID=A0A2H6KIW9_9APIC|nr:uncharacterized protein BOVATA_044140 [Babesia ovata]GBE62921.1 hypothetical protein, conserved [Babesia ovata]
MDEQRASSLEEEVHHGIDVIVKLTQFSGSEKSIETLINKEIERLEKQHKDCENCQKSHPSSDCPQHKKLEELRKKLETLQQNNKNSPRDLLNNLCTGLEKFLGYENGNYTGEGIVYSDLDRLCDGVMAFLHGVLNEVHKNNNLSPYKETLKDAVTLLESKRYEGKTGLHTVIDDVKRGIERWLGDVNEKSEAVKKPLNDLNEHVKELNDVIDIMKNGREYDDSAKMFLMSWMGSVKELPSFPNESSNNIEILDQNLRTQLLPHVTLIKDRVDTFVDSTKQDHEGLVKVCGKVDEEMKKITDYAEEKINEATGEVDSMTRFLSGDILMLRDIITRVTKGVAEAIKELEKWETDQSNSNLHKALNKCDAVVKALKYEDGETFKTPFDSIEQARSTVQSVHGKLSGIDGRFSQWITQAGNNLTNALKNVQGILAQVQESNRTKITSAVENLRNKTRDHFLNSKKEELKGIGLSASEKLGRVDDAVASLLADSVSSAQEQYNAWVESGTSNGLTTAAAKDLQLWSHSAQQCLNVAQAVTGGITQFQRMHRLFFQSSQLSSSIVKLQKLQKLDLKILQQTVQSLQRQGLSATLPTKDFIKSHHTLTSYVSSIREVMNASSEVLSSEIKSCERNITTLEVSSDTGSLYRIINPLNDALQKSSQFIQQLQTLNVYFSQHRNGVDINNISAELSGLMHRVQQLQTTFGQHKEHFESFARTASDEFGNFFRTVKSAAEKPNGLQKYLKDELQDIYFKQPSSSEAQDSENNKSIQNIYKCLHDEQIKLTGKAEKINSGVEGIQAQLTKISNMVEKKTESDDGVKDYLNELKNEIQKLKSKLTELKADELASMIDDVSVSFSNAKSRIVQYIQYIANHFKSLATTAATSIKRQALSQFAQSKARALEQLKALVTEQKTKIEEIIQKDSDSGLKGLMKWMNGGMHQDPASKQITPGSKFEEFISAATKLNQTPQQGKEYHEKFCDLSTKFKDYVAVILQYIEHQVKTPIPGKLERNPTDQSERVKDIKSILDNLLAYLKSSDKICHFDHVSTSYLDALNASGMEKFTEQLGHAYVNKYSGCKPVKNWDDVKSSDKLSTEGRNCAKVCLTILEIFSHDLNELKHQCETNWKNRKICLKNGNGSINDLGLCLKRFGYGVPSREDVQDDELRCSKYMNGNEIFAKLTIPTITERDEYNVISTLKHICDNLLIYYRVCHYSTLQSKTYPSSVYQMLLWLAGLPYNPVYDDLSLNGFGSLLDKPEEQDTDTGDESLSVDVDNGDTDESRITLKDENEESLDAYKEKITVPKLYEALAEACSHAHSVLTSILGHGHAGGIYAVDFNTNEDKFSYPSDMNSLICMLFEIVKRLHDQLYFLYRQCMHDSKLSGWSDCWYGHDIGGTAWKCNTLQCPNQSGDQIANQTHKQTCNQKCNQSVSCGVKSPLQSFLEDGLQGFLPHSLKSERGKLECSVKPHFNLPCKTPMGFSDISHMASHRQTGRHIREALFDVCSGEWSAFSRLCSLLNCLLPSAPKTLDDMFGFYFNLVNGWNKTAKQAFDNAINEANFNRTNARLDISAILKSNDHGSGDNMPHLKGDLHSLVDCKYNGESHPAYPCGPYVQPLCYYRCGIFAAKNNDKYVSWIVYLTESFLELLEKLYEECCKNCDSATSKCKISKCKDDCKAKDAKMSVASTHNGSCNSIVHCNLMRPTMYRCGFVFQSIYKLSGTKSVETKRTCKDFCNALKKVINKEEKLQHVLAHFVYRTIPEYLLKIRFPFMSLLLTLWSLSLLYLLHITVVRLDVLRIRSHLRSPSSHRIAAQSLLAAARVKALANVKYFSP